MKKDVKKMLAEHRADILPDERVKEKVKRDLGLSEVRESRLSYAQGGEHALTDKKKVFIAVVTVLLVAAIFLGVFLPLQLGGGTQPGGVPIIPDNTGRPLRRHHERGRVLCLRCGFRRLHPRLFR